MGWGALKRTGGTQKRTVGDPETHRGGGTQKPTGGDTERCSYRIGHLKMIQK